MLCTLSRAQVHVCTLRVSLSYSASCFTHRLYSNVQNTIPSHAVDAANQPANNTSNDPAKSTIRTNKPINPEQWQKWINYDSAYDTESDHLNRARHFFFHIDTKGKLLRRELAQGAPPKRKVGIEDGEENVNVKVENYGVLTHASIVDRFYNNLRVNQSDLYKPPYGYVSHMGHERYFATCAVAPVVFWNLSRESEDMPWRLTYASTLSEEFDPAKLRVSPEGLIFHPVVNKTIQRSLDRETVEAQVPLWGLLSTETAQMVLDHCVEDVYGLAESDNPTESDNTTTQLCIEWDGKTVRVQEMSATDLAVLD